MGTLLVISCASTINVRTDFNRQADFTRYRTFSIRSGNSSGNPVMDQRLKSAVEAALRARALEEVPSGEGDVIAVAHTATRTKRTYETFYTGRDGGGAGVRQKSSSTSFEVGTIVVDMFDESTKTAVWHGYASHVLSDKPGKNAGQADKAVAKIVERFPAVLS